MGWQVFSAMLLGAAANSLVCNLAHGDVPRAGFTVTLYLMLVGAVVGFSLFEIRRKP